MSIPFGFDVGKLVIQLNPVFEKPAVKLQLNFEVVNFLFPYRGDIKSVIFLDSLIPFHFAMAAIKQLRDLLIITGKILNKPYSKSPGPGDNIFDYGTFRNYSRSSAFYFH